MAKDESRRGEGGKRRHSSGRQEKIDGGEASNVDFNETAVEMAARDMRSPKTYFSVVSWFMVHAWVSTKSQVRRCKTNSEQQEKQTRNAFFIYTHHRRLGPAGFTQFIILHEESHATFKNSSPVTAKQGEPFARAHKRGEGAESIIPRGSRRREG